MQNLFLKSGGREHIAKVFTFGIFNGIVDLHILGINSFIIHGNFLFQHVYRYMSEKPILAKLAYVFSLHNFWRIFDVLP